MAEFQIVQGQEDKLFLDMGLTLSWESSPDRQLVTFTFGPVDCPGRPGREVIVHITGDVEIHPALGTLEGSPELRQWASLLVWCLRNAYDKVFFIFPAVDQLHFK